MALTYQAKGTIRWTAPELIVIPEPANVNEDAPKIFPTAKSDIYSFGGIMLQVRCLSLPALRSGVPTMLTSLSAYPCSLTGLDRQTTISLPCPRWAGGTGHIQGGAPETSHDRYRHRRPMGIYNKMLVF